MSEVTQEGIDKAITRVDGLDKKIQEILDPGDKEVFMAELESIKSEVRDIMVDCRQVSNEHQQAILEYQEEMKNCLALLSKVTPPQPK